MTTITMELTEQEAELVLIHRGQNMTGYPHHTDDRGGRHYFWPWGTQPNDETMRKIADVDVIRAAEKFLVHYERFKLPPGSGLKGVCSFDPPKLKKLAPIGHSYRTVPR